MLKNIAVLATEATNYGKTSNKSCYDSVGEEKVEVNNQVSSSKYQVQ